MNKNESTPIVSAESLIQAISAMYDNGALDKPVLSEAEKAERANNTAILKANISGLKYAWFKVTRRYDSDKNRTTYKSEVIYYDGGIKTPSGKKSLAIYSVGDSTWHTGDSSLNIPAEIWGNAKAMTHQQFSMLESFIAGINAGEMWGVNHLASQLEVWRTLKADSGKHTGKV